MGFANETEHTARKEHRCDACNQRINAGSRYVRWAGTTDGDFSEAKYHLECRQAEIALNKLAGTDWDEWMGLDDMEADDWPWLLADYPVVATRCGVTQTKYDEAIAERARCAEARKIAALMSETKG